MCSANLEKRRKLALDSELTNVMLKDSQLVQPEGDDGKDTSEPAAEFRPKPCCTLGICICPGANKDVAFFISNLKMYFPVATRSRLKQGNCLISIPLFFNWIGRNQGLKHLTP